MVNFMLSYHTDTQNPESLPFCIQVRGDRELTEKHIFNIRAVKTRQARGQRLTGRCYHPGGSLLAFLSRMAGRGPFQEEGAERTKTPRQEWTGGWGNPQEASGMELSQEGRKGKAAVATGICGCRMSKWRDWPGWLWLRQAILMRVRQTASLWSRLPCNTVTIKQICN